MISALCDFLYFCFSYLFSLSCFVLHFSFWIIRIRANVLKVAQRSKKTAAILGSIAAALGEMA